MQTALALVSCLSVAGPEVDSGEWVAYSLQTEGNIPDNARAAFEERLTTAMSYAGHHPAAVDVGDCGDLACMGGKAHAAGSRVLIHARVEAIDRDYVLHTRVIGADGRLLSEVESSCDICTYDEAADAMAAALTGLGDAVDQALAAGRTDPETAGTIGVRSTPSGATVSIDGERVGATPYEGPIAVGTHELLVEKRGRATALRSVDIDAGERETIDLSLDRGARVGMATREIIGWSAIALSIPLLVAGPVLIGIDGDPYEGACTGKDVDAFGHCRFQYDTLAGGIALTVSGVAAAAVGTTFVALERRKHDRRGGAAARLRAMPTIGGISVSGGF